MPSRKHTTGSPARSARPPRSSTQCDATSHASANQDRAPVPVSRTQLTDHVYLPWPALPYPAPILHSTAQPTHRRFATCSAKHVTHSANTNTWQSTAHQGASAPKAACSGPEGGSPRERLSRAEREEEERRQGLVCYFGGLQRYAPGLGWGFAVAWGVAPSRRKGMGGEGWSYRGGGSSPVCWRRGPRDMFVCLVVVEGGGWWRTVAHAGGLRDCSGCSVCGRSREEVGEWGMRGPGTGRLGRRCDCDISGGASCEIRASWADAAASEADVGIRAGGLRWWCRWVRRWGAVGAPGKG
jgi:hypothetical protein